MTVPLVLAAESSIRVGNAAPAFTQGPSDGASHYDQVTVIGDEVVFGATAEDLNGDDYYLAVCQTDAITPTDDGAPVCDDGQWAVSPLPVASGQATMLAYTTDVNDKRFNDWFAFVCDHNSSSSCSGSSQGTGDSASPFVTPAKLRGILRFGAENCPDLAEMDRLLSDDEFAADALPATEPVGDGDVLPGIEALSDDALVSLRRTLTADERNVLADAGKTAALNKRDRLQKLKSVQSPFCVTTGIDQDLNSILDQSQRPVQRKDRHQIAKEGLQLEFLEDEARTIQMNFRREVQKTDAPMGSGPAIHYRDPDVQPFVDPAESATPAQPTEREIYRQISLRHELPQLSQSRQGVGGVVDRLLGRGREPAEPSPFQLSVFDSIGQNGAAQEAVVYESEDNRKIDYYEYDYHPNGILPHKIKNYTVYHFGDGEEEELYTFENAVLHLTPSGEIEGYYFEMPELDPPEDVSPDLLERATRVIARDQAQLISQNAGGQPDFRIPAPFALNKNNSVLESLTYEVTGDFFNQLQISFSARPVDYPLVLDPTIQFTAPGASNVSHTIDYDGTYDSFGSMIRMGDLNHDGRQDLVVGSKWAGSPNSWGAIHIFFQDGEGYPDDASGADARILGGASNIENEFGLSFDIADLDDDGDQDLVAGASRYNNGTNQGRAYIFWNNRDGVYDTFAPTSESSTVEIITGESSSTRFGTAITTGDLDGDGDEDLVVGAHDYSSAAGRSYIFLNDESTTYVDSAGSADVIITGEAASNFAPWERGQATGDFNADGIDDLAVGAYNCDPTNCVGVTATNQGKAYIYYSDGAGFLSCTTTCAADTNADVTILGHASFGGQFGFSLDAGDLDADGDEDLVVHSFAHNGNRGAVTIFYNDGSYPTTEETADVTITGTTANINFGRTISVGDVNNDGKEDLVAGAYLYDLPGTSAGRAFVYYNDGSYPSDDVDADIIIDSPTAGYQLGLGLGVGDLNEDGTNDLAVGAFGSSGRVYLLYGQGGLEQTVATITGETDSNLGFEIEPGDYNGDGKTDLAIGAYEYNTSTGRVYIFYNDGFYPSDPTLADVIITGEATNDYFGISIEAGDYDADGDDDLAVGAYQYSSTDDGRVYIFYNDGSYPSGAASADEIITETLDFGYFGRHMTTGDLDNDGDDDLAVGAYNYNSPGRAYFFYNDGSYPTSTSGADVTIDGETDSNFGYGMATGDFDHDGDTDIAIGADVYSSSAGRAYIFYNDGAYPSGAASADVIISGETNSNFGSPIAPGDYNADGTTDLAIGARTYSSSTGRAYIFYNDGSIPTSAASADVIITGEGISDFFGAGAIGGDVDSDGDDDLIVGSLSAGRGYIFYNDGSIPTTAATADVIIDDITLDLAIGDFNHDGLNDLAAGHYAGVTYEGKVNLFYGDTEYGFTTLYPYPSTISVFDSVGYRYDVFGWEAGAEFGTSLAAGDVDGDGDLDLAVGASTYNSSTGRVYLFLNDGNFAMNSYEADVTFTGAAAGDEFGNDIALGPISETADLYADLLVGAPGVDTDNGAAYIFNSNGDGTFGTGSCTACVAETDHDEKLIFGSNARCGTAVDIANYNNVDARLDIGWSCPNYLTDEGIVFFNTNDGAYPTGFDGYCYDNGGVNEHLGTDFAGGDINGDGLTDIIMGGPNWGSDAGRVVICDGHASGYPTTQTPDVFIEGETAGDLFGSAIAVGKISELSDQLVDLVVGAPGENGGDGRIYIYNNADGTNNYGTVACSGSPVVCNAESANDTQAFGTSAWGSSIAVGNFGGDHRDDILVGGPTFSSGSGIVGRYYNDGAYGTDTVILLNAAGNGNAVLIADLTNDGQNDLIVAGNQYDSGRGYLAIMDMRQNDITGETGGGLGNSLATGDFDGDGDLDLAVGSSSYNSSQGRVYVIFNDPLSLNQEFGGLVTDWAAVTITGNATGDEFGYDIAAGKISETADSIDDLLIGAPGDDLGDGYVYILNGNGDGTFTASSCTDCLIGSSHYDERIQFTSGDRCGHSVAVADFLGDTREDIAWSCPNYLTDEGIVFFNTNDGAYPITWEDYCYYNSSTDDTHGWDIAAVDADGDGDKDLVAGAPGYNSPGANTGRVGICYNDGDYGINPDEIIGAVASGDRFGQSVAGGDLNNDGLEDIAIGAPETGVNAGTVYLFYNDGTGVYPDAGSADVTIAEATTSDDFGNPVRLGDYNNDGLLDLLVSYFRGVRIFLQDGIWPTDGGQYSLQLDIVDDVDDLLTSDLDGDGFMEFIFGSPPDSSGAGDVRIYSGHRQNTVGMNTLVIADTGGFTNDTTPNLTTSLDVRSGVPLEVEFSCDGGANWNKTSPAAYPDDNVVNDGDGPTFDITTGTGCTTTNETKTILARLVSAVGLTHSASDTTFFDNTGPTVAIDTVTADSISQITVTADTPDDGSGVGATYDYFYRRWDSDGSCTATEDATAGWLTNDNTNAFTGLSANTLYSFTVQARDNLNNEGAQSACSARYTLATIPGAPLLTNVTGTTIDTDLVSGGGEDSMTLYVETGATCDGAGGLGYVQSNGTIGGTEYWETEGDWGTGGVFTVTGLTEGTQYSFCAKARNSELVETGFGSTATTTTSDTPAFTVSPAESWDNSTYGAGTETESSTTTPTHVGHTIDFKATAADGDSDYYLIICKTGTVPTPGAPPECDGGSGNRWALSAATADAAEATASYTTQAGDAESNDWWGFVCDAVECSTSDQGAGGSGTPFAVNHAGTFGTATITDDTDGTIEPGDTLRFTLPAAQIADADTGGGQDTLTMHVCTTSTSAFDYVNNTCTGGSLICSSSAVNPTTTDATCDETGNTLVPIPTAHGTPNVKIFVEDNHNFATGGTNQQNYIVQDVSPVFESYTDPGNPTLTAGSSTAVNFTVRIRDDNGTADINGVTGVFFDADNTTDGCVNNDNQCYSDTSCTDLGDVAAGSCSSGTENTCADYQCDFTVWFNANAGANWEVSATGTDGTGVQNFADSNFNSTIGAISGIDVVQTEINYGSFVVGVDSTEIETSIANVGNTQIDYTVEGDTMCTDYPTCSGNTIAVSQQKWNRPDGFNYTTEGYNLQDTANSGCTPGVDCDETFGCVNDDLAVRGSDHTSTLENESLFWLLRAPVGTAVGSYTGQNTFSAISDTSCTGTAM